MPTHPVSPKRVRIMLMGIVGSLAGGLGLLLLLDLLNQSVKSVDEVRDAGLPVVAVIPKIVQPADLLLQRKKATWQLIAGGAYFCVILAVVGLEIAGFTYLDNFFGNINVMKYLLQAKSFVRGLWT
jgi:hypothetical protein